MKKLEYFSNYKLIKFIFALKNRTKIVAICFLVVCVAQTQPTIGITKQNSFMQEQKSLIEVEPIKVI